MKLNLTKYAILAIAAIGMSACAEVGPLATASGNPERTVPNRTPQQISNDIMSIMASHGYAPLDVTANTLSFSKPLEGSGAVFYTVAMGNAYSSAPEMRVRFTVVPQGKGTHVWAFVNVAMQGAFGQNQNTDLTRGRAGREIQAVLETL